MTDLTTLILTYNEESNIAACINSVKKLSKRIIVIDSFSTDRTVEIAAELGAEVLQNGFVTHAKQFRHGLDVANIRTQWVLRLDADERLTEDSSLEIEEICTQNKGTDVNGIILRFEVNFLGRKLRHGGIYPFRKLGVFKYGFADIEDRDMDEHIFLLQGKAVEARSDSLHHDCKDLASWTDKHNKYSTKEVRDYFLYATQEHSPSVTGIGRVKHILKYRVYYKLPLGLRPMLYFTYRYLFKLGFLDGWEGLMFAVLQAFWYRFLVDAKIYEEKRQNVGKVKEQC